MKNLVNALLLASAVAYSGNLKIYKNQNEMTDEVTYIPSEDILFKELSGKRGFKLTLYISPKAQASGLTLYHAGIGNCSENDLLIILFEDGKKLSFNSWNDFNCDGDSWYRISQSEAQKLATTKIKKVMFRNGYSYDSYTKSVDEEHKTYFIELFGILKNKKFSSFEKEK